MESKKINQLATELTPALSDLTIIGDPTTGISKKITLSQMASLFTGTVEEYANFAAFPLIGVADTIYIALDTNVLYRWNTGTNAYVELSPNIINSLVFNDANGFDGTIALVGSVATLTITTALTTGSVGFIGASGALLQDNSNFFWDDTNNRLGLGTNAPTTALDVFGSGIIGRLNGTSTNNAFLGFASAGTNKWSIGNVQSDNRFRIYNEASTSELVSVLQTGEFGIGIANPTTKFHIDGAASALIANLDANVSVAKSVSFRSDNSNRFNIEVSGTESGSNAGADFFIRRYSDAGSLIDTPLTIIRSTGNATFSGILTTPQVKAATSAGLSINANSGTQVADFGAGGSANITFFGGLSGTSATFSGNLTMNANNSSAIKFTNAAGSGTAWDMFADATNNSYFRNTTSGFIFTNNTTNFLTIANTGISTFSGGVVANNYTSTNGNNSNAFNSASATTGWVQIAMNNTSGTALLGIEGSIAGTVTNGSLAYATILRNSTNTALQLATNNIVRATITSGGNVGIKTASPDVDLLVGATSTLTATATPTTIALDNSYFNGTTSGDKLKLYILRGGVNIGLGAGNIGDFNIWCDGLTRFYNGGIERVRITSAGYLKLREAATSTTEVHILRADTTTDAVAQVVNANTSTTSDGMFTVVASRNTTNNTFYALGYYNSGAGAWKLRVADSGNVTNTNNSYGAISDIKLKENIIDATPKLDNLLKVKIKNFNYIGSEEKQLGVIAQEIEQIFPAMIEQHEDFEEIETIDEEGNSIIEKKSLGTFTKSVKYSVFVPMLIKAIQELNDKIEAK